MTIFESNDLPPSAEVDPLIDGREVDRIMGGQSPSTRSADPEQRALAFKMTEPGRRTKRVRWLKAPADRSGACKFRSRPAARDRTERTPCRQAP